RLADPRSERALGAPADPPLEGARAIERRGRFADLARLQMGKTFAVGGLETAQVAQRPGRPGRLLVALGKLDRRGEIASEVCPFDRALRHRRGGARGLATRCLSHRLA